MRVLITNNTLAHRAGSELYVRDLALALLRRGHRPLVYSTQLGEIADELRAATVPVADDLNAFGGAPDIIHGHHHLDTMTALIHFDQTPALSFCHGWMPWQEAPPPPSPRIFRYLAVDDTCRDRLVFQHGIPEARVEVLLNFVDLARFQPRPPLPDRPARALIFSNYFDDDNEASPIREACDRLGIAVDVMGLRSGHSSAAPERLLGAYDLVFAKGRSALEAVAVGNAVIVCDRAGLGGMVTVDSLPENRRLNFGVRQLRERIDVKSITREILRYAAKDANEASARTRREAAMDPVIERLISIYREVIDEAAAHPDFDRSAEAKATSRYLRWLSPILKGQYRLEDQAAQAAERLDALKAERSRRVEDRREADVRLAVQAEQIETLTQRVADRDTLEMRVASLTEDVTRLSRQGEDRERLTALASAQELEIERLEQRSSALADLEARHAAAVRTQEDLERRVASLTEERDDRQRQLDHIAASRTWRWIRRYELWRARLGRFVTAFIPGR